MSFSLFATAPAFSAGILAVHALAELPSAAALAALAVPALVPWRGRQLWAAAALGALLVTWRAEHRLAERWPEARHGEVHELTGRIAGLPERHGRHWRFLFEPREAGFPRRIRVGWYDSSETLRGDECWRFALRLRTPRGSLNPGGFDYEGWLFREGIGALATVRSASRCAAPGSDLVLQFRQRVVDAIRAALPGHPAAELVVALTVGEQAGLRAQDWDVFRATGTGHLVAISGFNIAIVAGVAFFLARWAWCAWPALCLRLPAPRAGMLGAAIAAGLYALLAGFEPPVQRAALMLWIVLAAAWAHRLSRPQRVLALAWMAILILDPFAISAPGLWLSFGAVAAIFYVSLGRVRAPGLWHGLVALQLVIALALVPLSLFFFQGTAWIAPLANLVAVPFFTVLTPWALAAVLLLLVAPALGQPLLAAAAASLEAFREGLGLLAALPELWLPASAPLTALLLATIGIALLLAPRGVPLRGLGLLCLAPLLLVPERPAAGTLEVTALDVGQGLAVVVRTARHTLVYDAGPAFEDGFDAGESVVAPFLLDQGLRAVDLLVLSHGDQDHAGGVAAVRRLLRVRDEIGTAEGAPCRAGRAWTWDEVRFEVLHPASAGWKGNDGSCVLRIEGPYRVLLAGDIESAAEAHLAQGGRLQADLLLAPHHGSRTSSTPAFVAAVRPQVVVHAAGWRNHFRHPRPEVVARYGRVGAAQYVTGQGGAIRITQDPTGSVLQVQEYRREARRFWNGTPGP